MSEMILAANNLSKHFQQGQQKIDVLKQIDFTVTAGESVAVVGRSGSGKSTLLHLLAGLDKASTGTVLFQQQAIMQLSETQRCQLRNQFMGFIYQFHHLLPEFTAEENVMMPLLLAGQAKKTALKSTHQQLNNVGLANRAKSLVTELSGGERQRVAIARALINQPRCLLADEPTGNLDSDNAAIVFTLLQQCCIHQQTALVVVTHDIHLAQQCDRCIKLDNGQLV